MTNGQIWPIAKCQRHAAIESERKVVRRPYFYILGGAPRWGCWAVVAPAGSSVQPPCALWTEEEELQWTQLLRCGRSYRATVAPTHQLNQCEKGEVQVQGRWKWAGGREEVEAEEVEDRGVEGGNKLFQVSFSQCQDVTPHSKCHLKNREIDSRKNSQR